MYNASTGKWTRLTGSFGESSSYEWTASAVGSYRFYVEVKDDSETTVRSSSVVIEVKVVEVE